MTALAALAICNSALLQLGEQPLTSFSDGTVPARVAAETYQPIADAMMGEHPWWWNRAINRLSRMPDPPPAASGYAAAYQLPPFCFRVVVPYVDSHPACAWGLSGNLLLIDADADSAVELEYHTRVPEDQFHPSFRQALTLRLAAEMALPLTEDLQRANLLRQLAETEARRARHTNATEKPAIKMPVGRLQSRMRR